MDGGENWLQDFEFPATKLELIDAADAAEAPQPEIERLQRLTRETYQSRAELDAELEEG
jgi:hypothetical protein